MKAAAADHAALTRLYRLVTTTPSDINEHLEYMHDLCVELDAKQVVELGVRRGVSTIAFLHAMDITDGALWSCDIEPPNVPHAVSRHPRWTLVIGNDLDVADQAPECDVLFIDTSHAYWHTLAELDAYAPKARKAILLHDTRLELPDGIVGGPAFPVRTAVLEWHTTHPEWAWTEFTHNYGLGVLRR